jgi:hypothetical protein
MKRKDLAERGKEKSGDSHWTTHALVAMDDRRGDGKALL